MISVGGVAVIGGTSGLPAGGTAADLLTGDGAWTQGDDVVTDALGGLIGSVAGRAMVGDGAGGVQPTSAAVSTLLAAADAAGIRSAASLAARTAIAPTLDVGQGWTIVAPTSGFANGSALTFPGGDLARITLSCNGSMDALTGPRAERAVTVTARSRWRASVVPAARSGTSGGPTAALYVRNSAADQFVCVSASASANPSNVYAISQAGLLDASPLAGSCPWDGTSALEIRYTDAGALVFGVIASDGRFRPVANAVLGFVPSHVGVLGKAGVTSAGVLDFTDFSFEVME